MAETAVKRNPRRGATTGGLLLALTLALTACSDGPAEGDPTAMACRKVELVDRETGETVRGVEDLAADPATGLLFLAALDRWSLADAMSAEAKSLPRGALYTVPAEALVRAEAPLVVSDAARETAMMGSFHPHGLDLHRSGGEATLAVINRAYRPGGLSQREAWIADPAIEVFTYRDGALSHQSSIRHPRVCRPNDVAILTPRRFAVSNDHGCDAVPDWLEDLLGLGRATVVELNVEGWPEIAAKVLAQNIGFANGLAAGDDGRLYVAATREKAIRIYQGGRGDTENRTRKTLRRLRLEMGPDNMSRTPDGRLLVAGHPSLLSLALYRYRWFGRDRAPTRIVAMDPGGRREVLVDHPEGEVLSAATSAVVLGDHLFAGSVTDSGVMACDLQQRPASAD
ncbi:MAG: hypothetical protein R3316_01585 [Rhodovibrionaceae bacterium]|nr:hypothetical protein [Rhodovibrionaceae bacterium]